jgi:hypothetical protein
MSSFNHYKISLQTKMPNFGMALPLGLTNLQKLKNTQKPYKSNVIKF